MARINRGHHFLSGFGNEDYLEDFSMGRTAEPTPVANVSENNERFKLELSVPGFKREELDIQVDDLILLVTGKKEREEENGNEQFYERLINNKDFRQVFHLPTYAKADEITADHKDGILRILIPKEKNAENKATIIKIE